MRSSPSRPSITVEELSAYVAESQRGEAPVLRRTPPRELADRLGLRELIVKGGMTPRVVPRLPARLPRREHAAAPPGVPGPPDRLPRLPRRAGRPRARRDQQPDEHLRDGRLGGHGRVRGPALDAGQGGLPGRAAAC
ncbi:hypothetical protein ACFSTC_51205 [Nonomuraea ferruginea]